MYGHPNQGYMPNFKPAQGASVQVSGPGDMEAVKPNFPKKNALELRRLFFQKLEAKNFHNNFFDDGIPF